MLAKEKNTQLVTCVKYYLLLTKMQMFKDQLANKTLEKYQPLSSYYIVKIEAVQRLIVPVIIYYCYLKEMFNTIYKTYVFIKYRGKNKIIKCFKPQYKNITKKFKLLYLTLCKPCQQKVSVKKKT